MFGVRAKTIKNSVVANVELTADQWRRKYEKERDKNKRINDELELMKRELERFVFFNLNINFRNFGNPGNMTYFGRIGEKN